jgi:hypothetical protein
MMIASIPLLNLLQVCFETSRNWYYQRCNASYGEISFAEPFGVTSPAARNDASARLGKVSITLAGSKKYILALLMMDYQGI